MAKLWEQFKGHKTEILLVALAIASRLTDAFPAWPHWSLVNDLLTVLAGGTIGSRVLRTVKNGKPPVPPAGG